jgi:hypothetical protein
MRRFKNRSKQTYLSVLTNEAVAVTREDTEFSEEAGFSLDNHFNWREERREREREREKKGKK